MLSLNWPKHKEPGQGRAQALIAAGQCQPVIRALPSSRLPHAGRRDERGGYIKGGGGLKVVFLTETKCKIRFILVRFNCKRERWGKKWMQIGAIKGGEGVVA